MSNIQAIIIISVIILVIGIIIFAKINAKAKEAEANAELQKTLIQYKQNQASQKTTFKDVLGGVEGIGKIAAIFA